MEIENLVVELGLPEDTPVSKVLETYNKVCESCRETISRSSEKAERRMAKQKLRELESEIGPHIRRFQAKHEVEIQLKNIIEVFSSGLGSATPYFTEIDKWLPCCDDRNLELRVASLREQLSSSSNLVGTDETLPQVSIVVESEPTPTDETGSGASIDWETPISKCLIEDVSFTVNLGGFSTQILALDSVVFGRSLRLNGCHVKVKLNEMGIPQEALSYRRRLISRRHFQIQRAQNRVSLYDGHVTSDGEVRPSLGGTFLDGQKIDTAFIDQLDRGLLTLSNPRPGLGVPAYSMWWCSQTSLQTELRKKFSLYGAVIDGRSIVLDRADGLANRILILFGSISMSVFGRRYRDLKIIRLDNRFFFFSEQFGPVDLSSLNDHI